MCFQATQEACCALCSETKACASTPLSYHASWPRGPWIPRLSCCPPWLPYPRLPCPAVAMPLGYHAPWLLCHFATVPPGSLTPWLPFSVVARSARRRNPAPVPPLVTVPLGHHAPLIRVEPRTNRKKVDTQFRSILAFQAGAAFHPSKNCVLRQAPLTIKVGEPSVTPRLVTMFVVTCPAYDQGW